MKSLVAATVMQCMGGYRTSLSWPWAIMISSASLAMPFRLLPASAIMICICSIHDWDRADHEMNTA